MTVNLLDSIDDYNDNGSDNDDNNEHDNLSITSNDDDNNNNNNKYTKIVLLDDDSDNDSNNSNHSNNGDISDDVIENEYEYNELYDDNIPTTLLNALDRDYQATINSTINYNNNIHNNYKNDDNDNNGNNDNDNNDDGDVVGGDDDEVSDDTILNSIVITDTINHQSIEPLTQDKIHKIKSFMSRIPPPKSRPNMDAVVDNIIALNNSNNVINK